MRSSLKEDGGVGGGQRKWLCFCCCLLRMLGDLLDCNQHYGNSIWIAAAMKNKNPQHFWGHKTHILWFRFVFISEHHVDLKWRTLWRYNTVYELCRKGYWWEPLGFWGRETDYHHPHNFRATINNFTFHFKNTCRWSWDKIDRSISRSTGIQ